MPSRSNPEVGTPFHSLQATSHALQPMQTLVSVKKPILGGASTQPAEVAGSAADTADTDAAGRPGESTISGSPLRHRWTRTAQPARRE
ncbi:hypothetical protein Vlu01_15480 [Micromonospora lutea]|uniref:Uncharacterized protein n=1 Tax=Micromonospora lutea TaxID=419825 RepID=A0ABQ4ISL6_9ACTN|nr:hypothetical protein Vlu01_15480 [Micromonospora lutea]